MKSFKTSHASSLYGLVLSGGQSRRMGRDKSAISYHGEAQSNYLFKLLSQITDQTFISCRSDQIGENHLSSFPQIIDSREGLGPMGGIVSAGKRYPEVAWLVLACDMPYIDEEVLTYLVANRNCEKQVTCYYNNEKKWPEPLCSIYEPKGILNLSIALDEGIKCPRKVLMNSAVELLRPFSQNVLDNINTLEEYQKTAFLLKKKGDHL